MSILIDIPDHKFRSIIVVNFIAFFIIIGRLIQLQISRADLFLNKSTSNFLRIEKVYSRRGNILDVNGKLLATNRPMHNIYWKGTGNYQLSAEQQEKLTIISHIIGKNLLDDNTFLQHIKKAERYYKKRLISSDISFEQLSQIEEKFSLADNIIIETDFKRFYPYQSCASHILGYLGRMDVDIIGKTGLESLFEKTLRGKHGSMVATINSFGRKLAVAPLEDALTGNDIQTTLDLNLQTIVENIFPEEESGTCLLMDTETGAILAMISRPNFDPTIFLEPILYEDWQSMLHKKPFLNRAFDAHYPPGSIFKLVVTSAALEHGIITPETIWDCKGYITFAGRRYHCHEHQGHGKLTVSQALEQSCNPLFYDIGTKMSIDAIADYAHRFGLGEKTNIIFPEKNGLVPTSQWKLETKGEQWWPGETLSAAIGQSFLLVTPIQVARMIASIFSGYLITPRILVNEPIIKTPLNIKNETLEFLRQSMKKVVTQGTGKRLNQVKNIEIYAKTSTAQTSSLNKRYKGKIYLEHGWSVSQFRYKENPALTMVILIEHAGASRTPTLIARQFLLRYKTLMDQKKQRENDA